MPRPKCPKLKLAAKCYSGLPAFLGPRPARKLGDALLLAIPSGEDATLLVDSFLVSCRALGRGLEDALWAAMVSRAWQQGVRRVEAEYISTAKNGIVTDLYDLLGLRRIQQDGGSTRYVLEQIVPVNFPSWIALEGQTYGH